MTDSTAKMSVSNDEKARLDILREAFTWLDNPVTRHEGLHRYAKYLIESARADLARMDPPPAVLRPAGLEPRGCPTPGACSCPPPVDAADHGEEPFNLKPLASRSVTAKIVERRQGQFDPSGLEPEDFADHGRKGAASEDDPLAGKPYHRVLIEDDGAWVAYVAEFPGCITQADSAAEVLCCLSEAAAGWVEAVRYLGQNVPEPADESAWPRGITAERAHGAVSEERHRELLAGVRESPPDRLVPPSLRLSVGELRALLGGAK